MADSMIPDDDLLLAADKVTIWVACPAAPRDVWSLAEAVAWAASQPLSAKITLFRPPDPDHRAAWIKPEQIARLAIALGNRLAA
jgi:hypothetical protein